jgi:hypothetical protein
VRRFARSIGANDACIDVRQGASSANSLVSSLVSSLGAMKG